MKDLVLALLLVNAIVLATACFVNPSMSIRLYQWFQKVNVARGLCLFTLFTFTTTFASL